jgi:hypothetical protein
VIIHADGNHAEWISSLWVAVDSIDVDQFAQAASVAALSAT